MIQDVSIIHNLNFNSDHKMVRAKLTSKYIKKKRMPHNDSPSFTYTYRNDQLSTSLKESLKHIRGRNNKSNQNTKRRQNPRDRSNNERTTKS